MPVEISDSKKLLEAAGSAGISRFVAVAAFVLGRLGHGACELSVNFIDDDAMRGLNRDWRGKDATTDVLSFSQTEGDSFEGPASAERHLGDVVISVARAEAQAGDGGWTIDEEISRLLLHGILHLLGYDHETGANEAARMRRVENETADAMVAAGFPCAREIV